MNPDKLKKLQAQAAQVRIGGKGTVRRKKKVVHVTPGDTDDKKLQSALKKIGVHTFTDIEEVNMIKDDGNVLYFKNPLTHASLSSNLFAVSGSSKQKSITDLLPEIYNGMDPEARERLEKFSTDPSTSARPGYYDNADSDDDVPELIGNFEDACLMEIRVVEEKKAAELAAKLILDVD